MELELELDSLITSQEAAAELGISKRRVNTLIAEGRLPAVRKGQGSLIKREDLELVRDRPPGYPAGRPRLLQVEPGERVALLQGDAVAVEGEVLRTSRGVATIRVTTPNWTEARGYRLRLRDLRQHPLERGLEAELEAAEPTERL